MKHPDHSPEHKNQNHPDVLNSFSATDLGTSVQKRESSSRSFGLTLAAIFGFTGLATIAIAFPFIKPGFRRICLPYVPASDVQVSNVVKALQGSQGKVIDLGSGDGRLVSVILARCLHHDHRLLHTGLPSCQTRLPFNLSFPYTQVFAAAKLGYHSTGVDLNPWLIIYSKIRSRFLGLSKLTRFETRNLFQVDYTPFNNVIIFGVDQLMPPLEELLTTHAIDKNKTLKVIACRFPFPNLKPILTIGSGIDTVWIYKIPS